jgi:hypothetical protein
MNTVFRFGFHAPRMGKNLAAAYREKTAARFYKPCFLRCGGHFVVHLACPQTHACAIAWRGPWPRSRTEARRGIFMMRRDMNPLRALKAVYVDSGAILSCLTASRRHGGRDRRNPSMFLDRTRPDKVGAKPSSRAFEVRGPAVDRWACGEVLQYRRGCTTG